MKIPSLFYGSYIDVKKRLAVVCEQILKGKSFTSMLAQWKIIDSLTFDSGLYVLRTHDDISIRQANFHFTLFHKAFEDINGIAEDPSIDEFYTQLLNYDWGLLLFSQAKDLWFGTNMIRDNTNRRIPYLKAVLKFSKSSTGKESVSSARTAVRETSGSAILPSGKFCRRAVPLMNYWRFLLMKHCLKIFAGSKIFRF